MYRRKAGWQLCDDGDARGGSAPQSVTIQVLQREELMFEDLHFESDRDTLRPWGLVDL